MIIMKPKKQINIMEEITVQCTLCDRTMTKMVTSKAPKEDYYCNKCEQGDLSELGSDW